MTMDDVTIQIGASLWFISLAYVCAFLPWTFLASRDFLGPTWNTVRNARIAGWYNVSLTVIPACYVIAYIVIQGLSRQYTEMCAALVALFFSVLHLLRTLWGLWQLRCFRRWAHNSIDALRAMGVPYRLTTENASKAEDSTMTTAEIVERLLVNESIVENQIVHGKVRCFIKYADLALHGNTASDHPLCKCFKSLYQGLRILFCVLHDQVGSLFGRTNCHRMKQVPFQPVEVWLNWSVPFVAQGLGIWMKEFNVPGDPSDGTMHNGDISARERLDRRADCFSFQVLSSAWLQLWPELGLLSGREAHSPLHWNVWDENSKMAMGLISKGELLQRAMSSGEALPFGCSHKGFLEKEWVRQAGYGAYRRMLQQVVNELPVRREFDAGVEGFDIEKLEWLTILLDLGTLALRKKSKRWARDHKSSGCNTCCGSIEQDCLSDDAENELASDKFLTPSLDDAVGYESVGSNLLAPGLHNEAGCESGNIKSSTSGFDHSMPQNVTDVVASQALRNLQSQLNIGMYSSGCDGGSSGGSSSAMFQCLSIAGWWRSSDWLKKENRHVMQVGEMIDAWMSLLEGDQISFMNEVNGSDLWGKLCCLAGGTKSGEAPVADYSNDKGKAMQMIHAEVEKRRLWYDLANPMQNCEHLEQFVTFMGYSMETVRSRLGTWLRGQKGCVPQDSFRPFIERAGSVTVDLGRELSELLIEEGGDVALRRRSVQTRFVWELQQGLAREENKGPECVSNIALCILSYPSLCVTIEEAEREDAEIERNSHSLLVEFPEIWTVRVWAIGAPQRFGVRGKLWGKGECVSAMISVRGAEEESKFEWEMWRDAFLGRLMGLKEWQEERGIRSIEVQKTMGRMDQGLDEVNAPTGERILSWAGWRPFRFEFMRFELESAGLLQQQSLETVTQNLYRDVVPSESRHKTGGTTHISGTIISTDSRINRVQSIPVGYALASPEVLRHAYLLVEETFTTDNRMKSLVADDGVSSLMRRAEKCLAEPSDVERAVLLLETAASIGGNIGALERCIEVLTSDETNRRAPARAVDIMEHFVAKLVSERSRQGLGVSSTEVKKIRPGYERVIERFGDVAQIRSGLLKVLESILYIDPDEFMESVVCELQMMYCMSGHAEILLLLAEVFRSCVSKRFLAEIYDAADIAGKDTSRSWIGSELEKDVTRLSLKLCRSILSKSTSEVRQRAALSLATILRWGANGVDAKPEEAEALYRRVIEEGGHVDAMVNLGTLLWNGADGVVAKPEEAEALYRRAMDETGHTAAMINLGNLLKDGADGVIAKPEEAEALYRRAIEEGGDVEAMNNLGNLLKDGADGVVARPEEAESLYRRAIEEGGHVLAMYNLGNLLKDGADGVAAKPEKAESLYRRAVEEGGYVDAMIKLGNLVRNGADGVEARPEEAESLYRRAIKEGGHVNAMVILGELLEREAEGRSANEVEAAMWYRRAIDEGKEVDAMYNLGRMLEEGANGVERDMREAVLLYERAVAEGGDIRAMYRLGMVLETGDEDIEVDLERAEKLYEQAGEYEDAKERVRVLQERMG